MDVKSQAIIGLLFGGAIIAAYLYTRYFPVKDGFGGGGGHGGGGGGHGGGGGMHGGGGGGRGGGMGRGGGRGGGGMGRGGGGWHGGHGRGRGWRGGGWRYGSSYGGDYGAWPWWWDYWYDPFYYIDDSRLQNIEDDPCDCFGKYKNAMDSGVVKDEAKKILMSCVDKTLTGTC